MELPITKKSLLATLLLAIASLYLSYTFNACLVTKIHHALPKVHQSYSYCIIKTTHDIL